MTLREQIEALDWTQPMGEGGVRYGDDVTLREVLDIIDQHRCIPDRDALARALPGWMTEYPMEGTEDDLALAIADNIIAALEEP